MITLHQFELFVAVARNLSVSRAAEIFHVSPSSISQQLNTFQREQKAVFIKQTGRGIALTDQGREALTKAEAILAGIESFKKHFHSTSEPMGSLVLGASHGPAASVFPGAMRRFSARFPKVELDLRTSTSPSIASLVLKGQVALAVIANPAPNATLEMEYFREEVLAVFVASSHPLARKKALTPAEFSALPLVVRGGRRARNRTEELIERSGGKRFHANVHMRMDSPESIKAAVREGFAGIVYRDLIELDVDSGHYKILNIPGLELTGKSYIVYAKNKPLSGAGQAFLAELRLVKSSFQQPDRSLRPRKLKPAVRTAIF